jgi:hypothetical protein
MPGCAPGLEDRSPMQTAITTATDALVSTSPVPVELVRWPEERERNVALAQSGQLRLLLVAPLAAPPTDWDPAVDWIRLPADDLDIWRRVVGLQHRVRRLPPPTIDEYGLLRRGTAWVSLAPIEARILALLLEKPGSVCSRERLERAAWPDGVGSAHSLTAYIKRVRRRIAALGLAIRTVRQRGYFLEIDPNF